MKTWICIVCGFIYDEAAGWPQDGIPAGTRWEDVPDDWKCPECGVGKGDFEMMEISVPADMPVAVLSVQTVDAAPIVIVGSGHAGYVVAESIRKRDRSVPVVLLTEDEGIRYSKPQLSIAVSAGYNVQRLSHETADMFSKRMSVSMRTNCEVRYIDLAEKRLETSLGDQPYNRLILACGASPVRLPWYDEAVLSVNHLSDLERLQCALKTAAQVGVIGSGFVGCELANDLVAAGYGVSVIAASAYPLDRVAPRAIGLFLQERLTREGVDWHFDAVVNQVQRQGGAYRLGLSDGQVLTVDVIISAIGFRPRTQLAEAAGLRVNQGIVVNHECRTSDPNVFALGDVAEYPDGLLPFIAPIGRGAEAIANAVLGRAYVEHNDVFPVTLKTPAFPLVMVPTRVKNAVWEVEGDSTSCAAVCRDDGGDICGFALGGNATAGLKEWLSKVKR